MQQRVLWLNQRIIAKLTQEFRNDEPGVFSIKFIARAEAPQFVITVDRILKGECTWSHFPEELVLSPFMDPILYLLAAKKACLTTLSQQLGESLRLKVYSTQQRIDFFLYYYLRGDDDVDSSIYQSIEDEKPSPPAMCF